MNTKEMIRTIQIQNNATIVSGVYLNGGAMPMPTPSAPPAYTRRSEQMPSDNDEPQGSYSFINVNAGTLKTDDIIVVQTRDTFSLVKVVNPNQRANSLRVPLGDLKYVVHRVDTGGLNELLEAENNAMHQLALSEVTEKLEKFKTQIGGSTFEQVSAGLLAPMSQPPATPQSVPPAYPGVGNDDVIDATDIPTPTDAGDGGSAI